MKSFRLIFFAIAVLLTSWIYGQSSINQLDYWFDNQHGNMQNISLNGGNMFSHSLSTSSLLPGLHSIHLRYKQNADQYSPVSSKLFYKQHNSLSNQPTLEYWFDNDPSNLFSDGVQLNASALVKDIPTTSLSFGWHSIHFRFIDSLGIPSSVTTSYFMKIDTASNGSGSNEITALEYWFNNAYQQSERIGGLNGSTIVTLASLRVGNLDPGLHELHIRFRQSNGIWSGLFSKQIIISPVSSTNDSLQTIKAYRYWLDSELADTVYLAPQTNSVLTLNENIDLGRASEGMHFFHTQFLQSNGFWSSLFVDTVMVQCGQALDSVVAVNAQSGVYMAYFSHLVGEDFRIEYKSLEDSIWRTKTVRDTAIGWQKFNITPAYGQTVLARMSVLDTGVWSKGCQTEFIIPCRPQNLSIVVQKEAFCATDSTLVRAGYSGGYGQAIFLWSNGARTKRTYVQQGESISVQVTDAAGCHISDSTTASVLSQQAVPSFFSLSRLNPTTFQASWNSAVLPQSASLIGYRLAYRLRGSIPWRTSSISTDTFASVDFTGSGLPAGNYEFVVYTRYFDGTNVVNSNYSCKEIKGYTGSGNKMWNSNSQAAKRAYSVYPNPAEDFVVVFAPISYLIELLDVNGRILAKKVRPSQESTFNVSHLARGMYLIRISHNEGVQLERIIKQ